MAAPTPRRRPGHPASAHSARALPTTALAALLTLAGCAAPAGPVPTEPPPAPSATGTAEPTPAADACGLTDADHAAIRAAIETGDREALRPYVGPVVYVTFAGTEYEGEVRDPGLVLDDLDDALVPGATWTFDHPADVLAGWADSEYYGEEFGPCAIVGTSSEDRALSLTFEDGRIVREFIAIGIEQLDY